MEKLTILGFQKMIAAALAEVTARSDEFSKLDAVIGDGDHGEAIVTALKAVNNVASAPGAGDKDFKTLLGDMGFVVMMETSGSTSTLLGGLLLGMSDGVTAGAKELDAGGLRAMFKGGLEGVKKNTKAQVGDKTMMDALVPGVEGIEASNSSDIKEILAMGAAAAKEGAEKTVGMQANFGRARNYGEKSVGHMDSGAASWSTLFAAFADSLD